jgi:hypothetical protein
MSKLRAIPFRPARTANVSAAETDVALGRDDGHDKRSGSYNSLDTGDGRGATAGQGRQPVLAVRSEES